MKISAECKKKKKKSVNHSLTCISSAFPQYPPLATKLAKKCFYGYVSAAQNTPYG